MDHNRSGGNRRLRSRPHARGDGPFQVISTATWSRQAPRTWGWTGRGRADNRSLSAGPTHVGMDRASRLSDRSTGRRPHARGDGPGCFEYCAHGFLQAPRTWGWTGHGDAAAPRADAGPTHVGMDRADLGSDAHVRRRPHARGDGPLTSIQAPQLLMQAPRTWGWTAHLDPGAAATDAGPTHVGMGRGSDCHRVGAGGRPHARGDGPAHSLPHTSVTLQAPRTWGWTGPSPW